MRNLLFLAAFAPTTAFALSSGCFDPTPINESYHAMLGRDATSAEAVHFAGLIVDGDQVAWWENYYNQVSVSSHCYSYVGGTGTDPKHPDGDSAERAIAGIPSYSSDGSYGNGGCPGGSGKDPAPGCFSDEYVDRGGEAAVYVTGVYRTLFGKMPGAGDLRHWLDVYQTTRNLSTVAQRMQQSLPPGSKGSWVVIEEMFNRVLQRPPDESNCSFSQKKSPPAGSDCSWFWNVANGTVIERDGRLIPIGAVDFILHDIRSTTEAIRLNELPACYDQYPDQYDSHAAGEYIREVYRLLLSRDPTTGKKGEIEAVLNEYGYTGGDTRPMLKGLAAQLLNGDEYKKLWPSCK